MYEFKIDKYTYVINFLIPFVILVIWNFILLHWRVLYYLLFWCFVGMVFACFMAFNY